MDERKLIAGWAIAILILAGGVYFAMKAHKPPHTAESETVASTTAETPEEINGPDLSSKFPPLSGGEWLTDGGKAPDIEGKVVLLDFWGTFCTPCLEAIPSNNKLVEKNKSKGLAFVGISFEPVAVVEPFLKKVRMDYPILAGAEELRKKLNVVQFPTTLLYDRKGVLVWKGNQYEEDGKFIPEFEKALTSSLAAKP